MVRRATNRSLLLIMSHRRCAGHAAPPTYDGFLVFCFFFLTWKQTSVRTGLTFRTHFLHFIAKKKTLGMGGTEESRDYFFIAFKHVLVSGRTAASLTI